MSETRQPNKEFSDVEMAPLQQKDEEPKAAMAAASKAASAKVVTACTMYSFCSVSMVLTNKSLASR